MKSKIIYLFILLCPLLSLVPVLLLSPVSYAQPDTWYVDDDGAEFPAANFSTIQAAIDAANASDTIIVYNGTYNECLTINKSLTILSANGADVTVINGSGLCSTVVLIISSNVSFGAVGQGFNVTGGVNTGIGILDYEGEFEGDDYTGNSIEGNTVHNFEYGIWLHEIEYGNISGTNVADNDVYSCDKGITLLSYSGDSVCDNTIQDNEVHNCEEGILLQADWDGSVYGNDVLGNEVWGCEYGIHVEDAWDCDVYDNTIDGNDVYYCEMGIYLESWFATSVYDNTVSNNTVYNSSSGGEEEYSCGILLHAHSDGNVSDNTVEGNEVYNYPGGIVLMANWDGEVSHNDILDNTVYWCEYGIDLYDWEDGEVYGNTVDGNEVHHCGTGIYLWSESAPSVYENTVSNNTVYNCSWWDMDEFSAGIMLFSEGWAEVSDNTVEGNEVYDCSAGIGAVSIWGGNVTGNDIVGNTVYGGCTSVGIVLLAEPGLDGGPFTAAGEGGGGPSAGTGGGRVAQLIGDGWSPGDLAGFIGDRFGSVPGRSDGLAGAPSAAAGGPVVGESYGNGMFGGILFNTVGGNTLHDLGAGIILAGMNDGEWPPSVVGGNTVSDNTIYDCSGEESEENGGIGLFSFGEASGLLWNTVEGNEISNFPFGIIAVSVSDGNVSWSTIADNTVYHDDFGDFGIALIVEEDGGIYHTTVEGNSVYWMEMGILLANEGFFTIDDVEIRDNTLWAWNGSANMGNFIGVAMFDSDNIDVVGNDLSHNWFAGLLVEESAEVGVVGNRIHDNGEGIVIFGSHDVNIGGNDIRNNIGSPLTGVYVVQSSWVDINCNNIVGNMAWNDSQQESLGVYCDGWDEEVVDAQNNWWGDASGPGGFGPGTGDNVSDWVDYADWLDQELGLSASGVVLNVSAVPSMVSLYDMEAMLGWAGQDIYTLGPSYTDIIIETRCWENECEYICWNASVDLASLLLDILPEDFEETHVAGWSGMGQAYWYMWLDYLSNVSMSWTDYENGECMLLWDYELWLEDLLIGNMSDGEGPEGLGLLIFFEEEESWTSWIRLILEELRLGQHQVPVTFSICGAEEVFYVPLVIVDFQFPLEWGWNLRSTPIQLDPDWNTFWDLYTMGDGLPGLQAIITWDAQAGEWVEPGPGGVLDPLHAYYINLSGYDQIGYVVSREATGPPTRQLYAGWNLVAIAPNCSYYSGEESWPDSEPFPAMLPWDALASVYGQWFMAVTIYEDLEYLEEFYYWFVELAKDSYYKEFEQYPFTAYYDGSWEGWDPTFLTPGGGYWVYMNGSDILISNSSTPIWWRCLD